MMPLSCLLALPEDFRAEDILAFHRRDPKEISERVSGRVLYKGLFWDDRPACLTIALLDDYAEAKLAVDGSGPEPDSKALPVLVRRMLGLLQPVAAFEQTFRDHPQVGRLIARQPGLRVPVTASPFEALTWAVTGQQISVPAAVSLRRKLIGLAGRQHSSGLWCYPEAPQVALLSEDDLRQAGFSLAKSRTLLALARLVAEGQLPLDEWLHSLPVEEMQRRLQEVRGIGPWTINYVLLRGFGWLDGSLHGDIAVRRGLRSLLALPEPVSPEQAREWLAEFSPWRALVAAHLWKQQM